MYSCNNDKANRTLCLCTLEGAQGEPVTRGQTVFFTHFLKVLEEENVGTC